MAGQADVAGAGRLVTGPRTGAGGGPGAASRDLGAQATELLQRLIRFDTVNPPGDERAAVEHLRDILAGAGFECELLGAVPERPNLVARLSGAADGPALCYLGHVDTVLA
ncbi:MAG: hypothetical protein WA484_02540, partial [Solirubrobacteraceae bacterium]